MLFFLFFVVSCDPVSDSNGTTGNVYDLSQKEFNDFNVYNIKGNWDFYWDTLLTPQQIKNTNLIPLTVEIPNQWTNYKINGKNLPPQGYATYHTKIIAPANEFYSFKFKRIFLSCNIYINDSLALSIGKVAKTKKEYQSNRLTKEFSFYSTNDTIELTIQVANFSHKKAGILRPLKFGTPRSIVQYAYTNLLYDVFIIGALTFMMFFYFVLFLYQKQNKSNLYFALFLITEIISISLDRELVFMRVFTGANWEFASKLFYVSMFMRTLMFVVLIESFTKKYFSKIVKNASIIFAVVMSIFVIVTPMRIYSQILIVMIVFSLITLIYELFVTYRASMEDKNMFLSFVGLLIIIISAINDSLFEFNILKTFYSTGLGVFLFTLSQAILISVRNAKLQKQDEELSEREKLENDLKKALLTTPSYDLPASLNAVNEVTGIEKTILFTVENNEFEAYLIVEKNIGFEYLKQKVDWNQKNDLYDITLLKSAIDNKKNIALSNKNPNIDYKNLIILPIVKEDRVISVLYMAKKTNYLTQIQIEITQGLKSQFNSLINTALNYFLLQQMNTVLENGVKERTHEVVQQKEELDFKNQQLDEKVQLLEEQYAIQNEINNELQAQIEELDTQSKSLEEQTEQMKSQKEIILKQNKLIQSNIRYAKTILKILNLNEDQKNLPFKEFFHLDIAKDILSGDFFFAKKIDNLAIFGLGDCTGHGVPGSLMSIFSNRNLDNIIYEQKNLNNFINPAEVLNELRNRVKKGLSNEEHDLKDGLDLGLCVYNTENKTLEFAGAYNSLYIIRNNELTTLKGNRMPIGSYVEGFEFSFSKSSIKILPNDIIYLNSDGFVDQFSSEKLEKYYTSNFKKLILKISNLPLAEQKQFLYDEFYKWKGSHYQLDDVSVVGVKF
ncbi:MAG: SpoIIE family protein phosphatase [Bacteroidales bacterium]|nr:SpoIIE family protein phosphatase [Bacteroidales bacterium]